MQFIWQCNQCTEESWSGSAHYQPYRRLWSSKPLWLDFIFIWNYQKISNGKPTNDSELTIVKVVNSKLEKRKIHLEKTQAKSEQYGRRNNAEFSNIPNDIPDNWLENKVILICRESSVEVDQNDIEGCHRLLISRYI